MNGKSIYVTAFAENAVNTEKTVPEKFTLLKFGEVNYTKNGEKGVFTFDLEAAQKIVLEFDSRGRDMVIDYEHQTLGSGKAPAAGWIDTLTITENGLDAHVKYWTEDAVNHLEKGEYRYFSPTIRFEQDGTVKSVHSVALTNHPAIHSPEMLAASDGDVKFEKLCSIFGLASLSDGDDTLETITQKALEMKTELQRFKTEKLVATAFSDGKIAECNREWAVAFASEQPDSFEKWCEKAPRIVPSNSDIEQRENKMRTKSFSDTELEIFRKLGLNPENINN